MTSIIEIERSLKIANERLSETIAEESRQTQIMGAYGENFAMRLGLQALASRKQNLLDEIQQLSLDLANVKAAQGVGDSYKMALNGGYFGSNFADFNALSQILSYFQRFYTSVMQSITSGPTERGPIEQSIVNASRLRLVNTFPSSFGMTVERDCQDDLLFKELDVTDEAMEIILKLITNDDLEDISSILGTLGLRTVSSYRRLISTLEKYETDFRFTWSDDGSTRVYYANQQRISQLNARVSKIKFTEKVTRTISGELHTASLSKGTFELGALDGELIKGRFTADAIEDVRSGFGHVCEVEVVETSSYDDVAERFRKSFVLQSARITE
ncbi:hypothetical protein [Deinococcus sp. PESE-13]